jgi:hypothetical protein
VSFLGGCGIQNGRIQMSLRSRVSVLAVLVSAAALGPISAQPAGATFYGGKGGELAFVEFDGTSIGLRTHLDNTTDVWGSATLLNGARRPAADVASGPAVDESGRTDARRKRNQGQHADRAQERVVPARRRNLYVSVAAVLIGRHFVREHHQRYDDKTGVELLRCRTQATRQGHRNKQLRFTRAVFRNERSGQSQLAHAEGCSHSLVCPPGELKGV